MTIAIIVPTHNEEEGIGKVIDRIRKVAGQDWIVYVVDGCSTDKTVEIAKSKGTRIINIPVRGKGIAIKRLFSEIDADYAITMDGDDTYPPEEIAKILKQLETHDVVVGSRFKGRIEKGAMSAINYMGNVFLSLSASILYGKKITDICSGMWGFRKSAYKKMDMTVKHLEVEMNYFTECSKKNIDICEVGITYGKRMGRTKAPISVIPGMLAFWFLLKHRLP